jgi:hypothetical protein
MRPAAFLTALAVLGMATVAIAATRDEHKFKMTFTKTGVGKSTGLNFSTDRRAYQPPPPGQPVELRVTKTVFTLQKGAKINTSVVPACSKADLEEMGPAGCPDSEIGDGSATVITGVSSLDPVQEDVTLFAKKNGILAYLTGLQTQVISLSVKGRKITAVVPRICLGGGTPEEDCPNGEAVLKKLKSKIDKKKTKKGKLITTPPSCPANGKWKNSVTYTYSNGDTERKTSNSKCSG